MKYKLVVRALEFGPNHVHLFLKNCKKYSVHKLHNISKGQVIGAILSRAMVTFTNQSVE